MRLGAPKRAAVGRRAGEEHGRHPLAPFRVPGGVHRALAVHRHLAAAVRAAGDLPAIIVYPHGPLERAARRRARGPAPCRGCRRERPCARARPRRRPGRRARRRGSRRRSRRRDGPRAPARVPRRARGPTQVAAFSGPSRLSIHDITTVPSAVTAMPSKEWEMGRSSLTRRWPSQLRPPSRERDRRRSEAKSTPAGLGGRTTRRHRGRRRGRRPAAASGGGPRRRARRDSPAPGGRPHRPLGPRRGSCRGPPRRPR